MTLSIAPSITPNAALQPSAQPKPLVPSGQGASHGGLSFGDVLDAVNPLQHIPVLSSLYRAATGSQISAASQIAGDTLYGALVPGGAVAGLASSVANVAVKALTGKDISQYAVGAVASLSGSSAAAKTTPLIASSAAVSGSVAASSTAVAPVPLTGLGHQTSFGNGQYQRAQAFDALNRQLVKMAV